MSLFCLVHGSTQDARCWGLLAPELEKRGHSTVRAHLRCDDPEANTLRYAAMIEQALPEDAEGVIVVGHSASGYFLPAVAAHRKLRRMVFLASTLPKLGASFLDQLRSEPAMFCPDWVGKDPSQDEAAARHFLWHDCSAEVTDWALGTRIRLPLQKVMTETYPLERWPPVPASYILCTQDRTINPAWFRRAVPERLGVVPVEIASGHCPYLSRPIELAELLAGIAEAS